MNITDAAKKLNDLKAEKEQLEDRLKVINAQYKELSEGVIPKLMEDNEQDKVSFPGIGTIYLQADVHVSMNEGGNTCIAWFKKNGHKDIVKETVHPGTLKSWTKEQLENGGKLPPELKVHQFMKAILRRT
jgi:hypothetical protein